MLAQEHVTQEEEAAAVRLLVRARAQKDIRAAITLADFYLAGLHGLKKDFTKALEYYVMAGKYADEEAASEEDDSEGSYGNDQMAHCSYKLGMAYLSQKMFPNAKEAFEAVLKIEGGIVDEADIQTALDQANAALKA